MAVSARTAASPGARILIVDDEVNLRHLLRVILERDGHTVAEANDGADALRALDAQPTIRVVLCDVRMPRVDGMSFLDRVKGRGLSVVMMSAYGSANTAVEALNRGAFDYVSKPFRADEIRSCVRRMLALEPEVPPPPPPSRHALLAHSPASALLRKLVEDVADTTSSVLVTGEPGSGKSRVADWLHERSGVDGPCAVFRGSTITAGALAQRRRGTLVVDGLTELTPDVQAALVAELDAGRIGGGEGPRLIALARNDVDAAAAAGALRRDLLDRVAAIRLAVPPLRERTEDLDDLVGELLAQAPRRRDSAALTASADLIAAVADCGWPGNVRQLANAIHHAALVTKGPSVTAADLPKGAGVVGQEPGGVVVFGPDDGDANLSIKRHGAAMEAHLIALALKRTGGNRSQAARLVEISYKALAYKIRDYGLEGS